MKRIVALISLIVLAGCNCDYDAWRREIGPQFNAVCGNLCKQMYNAPYSTEVDQNIVGYIFDYVCVCHPISKPGENAKPDIRIKMSKETIKRLGSNDSKEIERFKEGLEEAEKHWKKLDQEEK